MAPLRIEILISAIYDYGAVKLSNDLVIPIFVDTTCNGRLHIEQLEIVSASHRDDSVQLSKLKFQEGYKQNGLIIITMLMNF